jgi:glyoxylase-like metal-dependent hydrolase (beta-lactamase superfamily II)
MVGINWMALQTPDATVVIDPVTWNEPETLAAESHLVPGLSIDDGLAGLGIDCATVTDVVLTHGHADHLSGVLHPDGGLRFASATHHFPLLDWQLAARSTQGGSSAAIMPLLRRIEAAGRLSLASADVELAPGIWIRWTGGESPGHQIVHAVSDRAEVLYLGDLVHFPNEVSDHGWVVISGRDEQQLRSARERWFARAAASSAAVVFTHGRFPAWGAISASPDRWRWRYEQPAAHTADQLP